ncbi:RluA family pseudouridine synthase [bacterium]|nr:RluA family pseudouridine synthase [bacterium]
MSEKNNDKDQTKEQNEGNFLRYTFVAEEGQKPLRIDKFLVNFIQHASRTKIQQAIENDQVLVNGQPVKSNHKVRALDEVKVVVNEEPEELEIIPQDIPLDVVYEDDDLLVINKAPGMVVHPGFGNKSGTLMNALAHRFNITPDFKGKRPWLVHRIDKNTSGLLVIAKNDKAMNGLSSQFKKHSIERKYVALVWGVPEEEEGTISTQIVRDQYDRKKYTTTDDETKGKHAVTHYRVLEDFMFCSLIECRLETGRTHQIRVHLRHLGHPLFNDEKYGGNRILKGVVFSKYKQFIDNCFSILPRQALHAQTLGFKHPISGEVLSFTSELPEDLKQVIEKWRRMHSSKSFSA